MFNLLCFNKELGYDPLFSVLSLAFILTTMSHIQQEQLAMIIFGLVFGRIFFLRCHLNVAP